MAAIGSALSEAATERRVWALGTCSTLTDARQHDQVTVISSVSGRSITNCIVATNVDIAKADGGELRDSIRPALRHVAHEGSFFCGPATNAHVYGLSRSSASKEGWGTGPRRRHRAPDYQSSDIDEGGGTP